GRGAFSSRGHSGRTVVSVSTRRTFVKLLGLAAGGGLLAACSPSAPPAQPTAPAAAAPKPTTAPPAVAATTAPAAAATAAPKPAAAPPAQFKEAPQLAQMVKDGKLPPVEKRLPDVPMVVQPIEEIGQYGGTWRGAFTGTADFHAYGRSVYESMLRWPRDPKLPIGPGLAEKYD